MAPRGQVIAPLSRGDAERLLPSISGGRQTLERRVLRARCMRALESFDVAWAELSELLPRIRDPLLGARVAADLVQLAYYLVQPAVAERLTRSWLERAAADPLLLAELRLGRSLNLTAQNELTEALREARWAEDALAAAPRGRGLDLVSTRLQRQLAHVLSHAGDHRGARSAAEATSRHAARVADPWEIAWAAYTRGFVAWMAGRNDEAVEEFARAEAGLSPYGTGLWRYTLFCLARSRMERGELAEGDGLARQSGTGTPEDLGHLALLRGEADVAERIMGRAPKGFPADEHFRDLVRGIVRGQRGDVRGGIRLLEEVGTELGSRGMAHWAVSAAVHAAYWREQLVRGSGAGRAAHLLRDVAARGGEGFAFYLPEVAAWLGRAGERDPQARQLARRIRSRAEAALRRAERDAGVPVGASALDEATFHLRALGLTWRELGILRELERVKDEGRDLDRARLAERLAVSPNTLRVHLTRIRAKLDVSERRGDDVLLEAAMRHRRTVA